MPNRTPFVNPLEGKKICRFSGFERKWDCRPIRSAREDGGDLINVTSCHLLLALVNFSCKYLLYLFSRRERNVLERYKDILLFCHILIICLISLNFLKIFYYKCIFIFFDKSQKNRQMFHEKSFIFRAICIIIRVLIL